MKHLFIDGDDKPKCWLCELSGWLFHWPRIAFGSVAEVLARAGFNQPRLFGPVRWRLRAGAWDQPAFQIHQLTASNRLPGRGPRWSRQSIVGGRGVPSGSNAFMHESFMEKNVASRPVRRALPRTLQKALRLCWHDASRQGSWKPWARCSEWARFLGPPRNRGRGLAFTLA